MLRISADVLRVICSSCMHSDFSALVDHSLILVRMKIDAHHHFWKYSTAEYGWIDDSMQAIRRDFLPADLAATLKPHKVDGVVSVQARQTLGETRWLLSLAQENALIKGVVGWVPLVDKAVGGLLDELVANSKLKGIRHVVQGEPDPKFLEGVAFNAGLREVTARGLAYDILIFARQLPAAIAFVDRHPNQIFVRQTCRAGFARSDLGEGYSRTRAT